jgi:hypothetical protein
LSLKKSNKYLIVAILFGLAFHGTSIFFTLESTYDALIHLFFADHYAQNWFETWNYKWYTGFTVMGYPPLVHQSIALLSFIGGLKFGLFSIAIISIVLFITGVYKFSLLITSNSRVAGYAAILAVFSSSFVETLHVYGQLPSIIGISLLLHALPEIYLWLKLGYKRHLFFSLSLIAVTVTSHHVTPIFGMVFFIFPLIGMVIMDVSCLQVGSAKAITIKVFISSFRKLFKRIISFGILSLVVIISCILPYWINTKNNPITQVPIPHGSRDNFLEVSSSGLVFFLIPWGILLFILPYIFYRYFSKRYLFFGLSITILFILGTGGTTFIPRLILGDTAFNILTLDRFTFWASIMSLPLFGEFAYRFIQGDLKQSIQKRFGVVYHRLIGVLLAGALLFITIFTMSLTHFRPSQPQQIKMLPIVNFLNQDQHDQWRYMTLGFGDQMAWLSAQTNAMSVDGNYHSARRLPELTTRPIERLENSKFKGIEGIGSLQQFLTTPEKYNFKYIFSNDNFYDPILYFCGWQRLKQLENGIQVWEKLNIPPISSILPKEDISTWQKVLWGIIPFITVLIVLILTIQLLWIRYSKYGLKTNPDCFNFQNNYSKFSRPLFRITYIWSIILTVFIFYGTYLFYVKNDAHHSPQNTIIAYYDALDFKEFEKAHKLINPQSNISISQYMLQISVADGLISSYAKLDAIKIKIKTESDILATLQVQTDWITALEKIKRIDQKSLIKLNNKWYIQPDDIDLDLPPDQLYSNNTTNYYNQGRRRITTEQTHHEDVLKQPVLEILSAKLVKYNNSYALIGEVQNIDNVPADVILSSTLYNDENQVLASFNAKYHVKHKLMPKEVTSFKINFEGIAWSQTKDSIPKTFNPDEFTPIEFSQQPTKFNLQVAGNVSGSEFYKDVAISKLVISEKQINGKLFNFGIKEVTIPQLLITYYNEYKKLVWVDHHFMVKAIRQQRQQTFNYPIIKDQKLLIINESLENCYVNGLPNVSISNKIVPNRIKNQTRTVLQAINHKNYSYVKIEVNSFIGNPN